MNAISKFVSSMGDALEFNQATLSGCVDIVVVRQPDGSLKSTPFHVRFGKLKLLKSKNTPVTITVNSQTTNLKMKLGEAGEGFFEEKPRITIDNETYTLAEKSQSEKAEKISSMRPGEENTANKSFFKMLQLNAASSAISDNMKAETGTEDFDDDCNEYKTGELVFLDEIRLKEVSQPASMMKCPSSLTVPLNLQRTQSSPFEIAQATKKTKVKTLRPNSAQLESLNLNQGINTITYTVTSNLQGTQQVKGNIFLWNYDDNIIISDIDGTITKSDVMGHLMSMVGKDWSQPGIAPLYTNIKRNGYHILYLTSRAIGQAKQTRELVNSIYQDGKMLPQGPLFTSPDRMLPSVKREIIYKRPEIFKMAVLKDIRSIFPADYNPFHAGFGNRDTDAIAYKSVGIPLEKVFIVNPKGDIHHHSNGTAKSYAIINTLIKDIFPGLTKNSKARLTDELKTENMLNIEDERMMQANLIRIVS